MLSSDEWVAAYRNMTDIPLRPMTAVPRPGTLRAPSTPPTTSRKSRNFDAEAQKEQKSGARLPWALLAVFTVLWIIGSATLISLHSTQFKRFDECGKIQFSSTACIAEFPKTARAVHVANPQPEKAGQVVLSAKTDEKGLRHDDHVQVVMS